MATPCIEWSGKPTNAGYGAVHRTTGRELVHRLAYEAMVGPIPEGMTIDHLCRNRLCWNPWHLEVVTMRENLLRGEGASGRNARKTHCPQGHEYDVVLKRGGRACRSCINRTARERYRRKVGG